MPSFGPSRWWLIAEGTVIAAVVALTLSLGGAPWWTTLLLLGLSLAAMATWSVGSVRQGRRIGWHPVLLVPLLLVVVAVLQLIPLPRALLGVLSPPLAELVDFALVPLGLSSTRPLSVDPASTARAAIRALSLGLLVLVSLELSRREEVRRRLVAVVALVGVAVAVTGYIHLLAQEPALFGAYHFIAPLPLVTPFGNTNHLSAFLALSALASVGLALSANSREAGIGWGVAALTCGLGVLMSSSRGGIGSFIAGLGLLGAALLVRRQGLRSVIPWLLMGATVTVGLLMSFEQLVERAASVSSVERIRATKVELWPEFASASMAWWRSGMGLGAFELGFTRHQTEQLSVTFTHPENLPLQWSAELGLPLTVVLLGLVGFVAARLWRGARSGNLETALFSGLAVLGLHDCFDFALELNAVPVAGAVVLGAVAAASPPNGSRKTVRSPVIWVGVAVTAVAVVLVALGFPTHVEAERALAAMVSREDPPSQVRARAVALVDRHPSDWVVYATAARDAALRGDGQEALAWVNRVMFLRPADTSIHIAAAQALLRLGRPGQALAQLSQAWALGDTSSLALGVGLARREGALDRLVVNRAGHLSQVYGVLMTAGAKAEARKVLEDAAEFGPSAEVQDEARALLAAHEVDHGDAGRGLELIRALPEPRSAVLQSAEVRALARLGRSDESVRLLEQLHRRVPSDLELGLGLVNAYVSQGRPTAALEILERLRPFASGQAARSRLYQVEAQVFSTQGRLGRAIEAMQTASRIEPQRPDLHYRLAELFERMGSLHSALEELRKGRTLDTPEGRKANDAWLERLKGAAETSAMGGSLQP